jgi:2-polyprenyl-6-methoxyphenol hydroxylase-like FAD-dependent oxidoreductase
MNGLKILISGASIAGPTLAHWLARRGADVTVVEQAPSLRQGGHGVDFRGAQMELLDRMGITDEVRARETGMGTQTIVDASGKPVVELPSLFFSGEVEIARGDLSRILYERTREHAEYVFDDSVTALHDTGAGVDVEFRRGPTRRFDLVVGADGMHSRVRAWPSDRSRSSPRSTATTPRASPRPTTCGWTTPGWSTTNPAGRHGRQRSRPLRARRRAGVQGRPADLRPPRSRRRPRLVVEHFAGCGWETPRLLRELEHAPTCTSTPWSRSASTAGRPVASGCSATPRGAPVPAARAPGWP